MGPHTRSSLTCQLACLPLPLRDKNKNTNYRMNAAPWKCSKSATQILVILLKSIRVFFTLTLNFSPEGNQQQLSWCNPLIRYEHLRSSQLPSLPHYIRTSLKRSGVPNSHRVPVKTTLPSSTASQYRIQAKVWLMMPYFYGKFLVDYIEVYLCERTYFHRKHILYIL